MEGYTHALSGAAAWMAVTSSTGAALGAWEQPPSVVIGGAIVCAGWAMWPDADHADATIAHSLPPVTGILARFVHRISGGHRHGTHSLIGVAVFTIIAALAAIPMVEVHGKSIPIGSAIVAATCIAFASASLGLNKGWARRGFVKDLIESSLGNWILAIGGAVTVTWLLDYRWTWLPACAALGVFVHILGDCLTPQGVPWLWPWNPKPPQWWAQMPKPIRGVWHNNGYFRLPLLGTTQARRGKRRGFTLSREHILAFVIGVYVLYVGAGVIAASTGSSLPYVH